MARMHSDSTMSDETYPELTELSAALLRYVTSPSTDYAVMLNGTWGSGKTYFWKHAIAKEIKDRNLKTLYVSLYGVSGSADIDWRILEEISPTLVKTGFLGSTLAKWGMRRYGIDPDMLYYRSSLKDFILCFDDLERANCSKTLVLGHLNRFVEHDGLKLILIANERGIPLNDDYWVSNGPGKDGGKDGDVKMTINPSSEKIKTERVNTYAQVICVRK